MRAAGDLDHARAEADGIVAGHAAGMRQLRRSARSRGGRRQAAMGSAGRLGEAAVVVGEIGRQVGLGRGHGRDPVEAQLGDEAILEGGPEALDAALGLGGMGADVADAEVAEDLAELGGMLSTLELLLETPVGVIADEDAEAIAVEGHGQAMPAATAAAG